MLGRFLKLCAIPCVEISEESSSLDWALQASAGDFDRFSFALHRKEPKSGQKFVVRNPKKPQLQVNLKNIC